ncbi:unnamed protein product, partial [marine sediment metagenome]
MSDSVLSEERKNVLFKIVAYAVFIGFAILTIFPLVWLFYSSFKPKLEILRHGLALPKNPTLQNYVRAWELGHLGEYAINSLIYTFFSTGRLLLREVRIKASKNSFQAPRTDRMVSVTIIG